MQNIEYNPLGWAKDKVLKDEILKALRTTEEKDFIFAVSVQGHGKYPDSYSEPDGIRVGGLSAPAKTSQYEYYEDQIREMDDFLRELVDALSAYDEDVVLVLYGDHLPSLDITDGHLSAGSVYQTEYVIWSNTTLPEQDEDLEAFQLTAKVFDLFGISGTLPPYHTMWKDSDEYLENLKILEYDLAYGEKYALKN